jgi:hypothetical protein
MGDKGRSQIRILLVHFRAMSERLRAWLPTPAIAGYLEGGDLGLEKLVCMNTIW